LRGDKSKDIRLQPEDVIFIPPIGPMVAIGSPKTVQEAQEALRTLARLQLDGEAVPEMSWRRGENLKIMSQKDPGLPEAHIGRIFGMDLQEAGQKLAMSKGMDFGGAVKVPAIYELKNEKTLDDLLRLAGGLGDTAFKGRVQVLRIKGHQETVMFDEDLAKILAKYHGMSLIDGDFVMIFPVSAVVEKRVTIAGAVKSPGEFGFRDTMRVSDLINYAGGLLMQANKEEAEITRVRITPQGPETSRIYVRLYQALSGTSPQNVVLQPNDYLFIRTVPDWGTYKTVQVDGEVNFPGTYTMKKGEMLSSLLTRAGGFTSKAYLLGGVLIRESTRVLQKQQLHAAINRLEARTLVTAGQKAASATDSDDAKSAEAASRQQQMLIAALRKVEPLGRVVIELEDPERLRGTPKDIPLQEGDKLMIPEAPGTVNVVGAVFAPTALVFTPYRTAKEYLTMAGGTTSIADDKEMYVIKVNGAAVSRKGFSWLQASWDGTKYGFHPGGISSMTLDPGDTIVVPERLEQIPWLKNIKDVATILGNLALTAGIAFVALR